MPGNDASLRGRIAASERWAHTNDRTAATAPARAGLDARFAAEVDPDGVLDPAELARRIKSKRTAHFARLARLSADSRRKAAAARQTARQTAGEQRTTADAQRTAAELRQAADALDSTASAAPGEDDPQA
jgi:hypothetical protein